MECLQLHTLLSKATNKSNQIQSSLSWIYVKSPTQTEIISQIKCIQTSWTADSESNEEKKTDSGCFGSGIEIMIT